MSNYRTAVIAFAVSILHVALSQASHAQDILYSPQSAAYWTGFYVGGNIGYGWATSTASVSDVTAGLTGSGSININGVLGGAQAGFNIQSANMVYGIEADFQASGQTKSDTLIVGATTFNYSAKQTWFGTTRARAGVLIGPNNLLYGTGGMTYGNFKFSGTASGALVGSADLTWSKIGWVIGGGWESRLSPQWSVKAEYLYAQTNFWSDSAVIGGHLYTANLKWADNIIRVGANYKFYSF
jgi:outer membrane immunogenic protein